MGRLTENEKAARHRERLTQKAKEYQLGTYSRRFVAPIFQRMIRAEAASAANGFMRAVSGGQLVLVNRLCGQLVCVTCGKVGCWSDGIGGMHTGHFLESRRASILFEEMNVAPQCSKCNRYRSGAPQEFRLWMEFERPDHIERLERLRATQRRFSRENLVDMRIGYQARLTAAVEKINEFAGKST